MGSGGDLALKVILQAKDMASDKLKGFGSTLVNLAGKYGPLLSASFAVAGAVLAIGAASVQMAAQYQQQMNMVQALTGSNTQQMAYYDQQVKALAIDAGVAPDKLASGLYNVLSASYTGADAMRILTLATQDAKIGLTDAATTSNALTNVLRTFNIAAKDATRVNGEMLQTVTLGKATFAQYASNITKAASSSKQFHVSLETMNAAWATLTSTGISAGQATTDYTQLLSVMYANIGTVTKSLAKNGIAFNETKFNAMNFADKVKYLNSELEIANKKHVHITGVTKQAAQAIQAIAGHVNNYKSNLAQLSDKQAMNQKTADAWKITQSGLNQQMDRARAAVSVLMINIGTALIPIITKLVGAIAPAVTWLMNFATAVSHNQVAMAFIEAALITFAGVILAVLIPAFVAWAIGAWNVAAANIAAFWPIYLIVAIIVVVIAAVILAVQHWGEIAKWLQSAWAATVAFFQILWTAILIGLKAVGQFFVNVWNAIVNGVKAAWAWIVGIVQAGLAMLVNMFMAPFRAIGALFSWLYNHNYYFKALVDKIRQIIQAGLAWLKNAWQTVISWLAGLWHTVSTIATNAWNAVKTAVVNAVMAVVGWLKTQWDNEIRGLGIIWNKLKDLMGKAWQAVSGLLSNVWNTYIVKPLQNLWSSIVNFANGWPKQAVQWGINMIQGFINGLMSMLGKIKDAAGNIMKSVASILGFHSPAKEGEGRYIIQWGQGMIQGFSSGVLAAVPALKASVAMAVKTGISPMSPPALAGSIPYGRPPSGNSYSSNSGGNHYGNNYFTIPGNQNPDNIAKAVEDRLNRKFKRSGTMGNPAWGARDS